MEFKVGDKVKVLKIDNEYFNEVGVVEKVLSGGVPYGVRFKDGELTWFGEKCLVLFQQRKDFQNECKKFLRKCIQLGYYPQIEDIGEPNYNPFNIEDEVEFKNGNKYKIKMSFKKGYRNATYIFHLYSDEIKDGFIYNVSSKEIPNYFNRIGDYDFTIDERDKLQRKLDELQDKLNELRKEL